MIEFLVVQIQAQAIYGDLSNAGSHYTLLVEPKTRNKGLCRYECSVVLDL